MSLFSMGLVTCRSVRYRCRLKFIIHVSSHVLMDPDKRKDSDALVFFQDMKEKQRKESVSARELKKYVQLSTFELFSYTLAVLIYSVEISNFKPQPLVSVRFKKYLNHYRM